MNKNINRFTYDIESTYDLFTLAAISDNSMYFMLYGNEQFEKLTKNELINQLDEFSHKPIMKDTLNDKVDLIEKNVLIYKDNEESKKKLLRDIGSIIHGFEISTRDRCEYAGWNSNHYDLVLLRFVYVYGTFNLKNLTPKAIRKCSDFIINYNGMPWLIEESFAKHMFGADYMAPYKMLSAVKRTSQKSNAHIDWAKIAKSDDPNNESVYPPSLKKEMAKLGYDIVIDENVAKSGSLEWNKEMIDTLVDYNFNDVLGTKLIAQNSVLQAALKMRDSLHKMYPYTHPMTSYRASERDDTAANLSGRILIGPHYKKPTDYPVIDLTFPIKNGEKVNLLEYMKEHEKYMHPYFYKFFKHFEGKDTTTFKDLARVYDSQPITHSSMMNVPFYRNGKPIDAYMRPSAGGAHGSVMAGLSKMTEDQIKDWIIADTGALDHQKPTVDLENVLHADWDSFYPVMASKLKLYIGADKIDRYTKIITKRFEIKKKLKGNKNDYTEQDWKDYEDQMGYKFVLNNATGAGNTHKKWADLPVDNKTLSMRLIGNLLIWCLAQRLVQAGAYIISTNTDGLYFTGIELDEAQKIINEYVDTYDMGVTPEIIDRLINKDTSSRIELTNGEISSIRGGLRHGASLDFDEHSLGSNIPYPLVAANAAINYMINDKEWLTKPYNRNRILDFLNDVKNKGYKKCWYHVNVSTKTARLVDDDNFLQRVNRIILTKNGHNLQVKTYRALANSDKYKLWQHAVENDNVENFTIDNKKVEFGDSCNGSLRNLRLLIKHKGRREDTYTSINVRPEYIDYDNFKALMKQYDAKYLGIIDENIDESKEIHENNVSIISRWKLGKMMGYPSQKGRIINTYEEVKNLDLEDLDINAYADWAERLLLQWKSTANIPEIGMNELIDKGLDKHKSKRKQKGQELINMYDEILAMGVK